MTPFSRRLQRVVVIVRVFVLNNNDASLAEAAALLRLTHRIITHSLLDSFILVGLSTRYLILQPILTICATGPPATSPFAPDLVVDTY